jgi:hypothetical protein
VTRAFSGSGRGARRRVEVRLPVESRRSVAELLLRVHELLEDPRVGQGPPDPLEELTGLDASAFDTSAMDDEPSPPASSPSPGGEQAEDRRDPAIARLLPDAHRDDPALAEEFRRLTEHGLRRRKQEALALAAAALRRPEDPLRLTPEEGQALVRGLTDVRLVLAERLGIRTDDDAQVLHEMVVSISALAPDSVETKTVSESSWAPLVVLYDDLTGLQEDLVRALMR